MTKLRLSAAEAAIAAVAVGLAVLAIVGVAGSQDSRGRGTGAPSVAREVGAIAHRVERIRGLRFRHVPRPLIVTPAQTRRESLREFDREYPAARRHDDQEVLELLGLLRPGTNLRTVEGDVSGGEVAGYYDTRRKRLAVVSGPASQGVLAEVTLAHELNHALEDQRFGVHDTSPSGADDGATAYTALVEGTATSVMDDYTGRFVPPGSALVSAFAALGPAAQATTKIPPYIQRSLEFSYSAGERFVRALRLAGHGWRLVNRALARRPPVSSEQVMHPQKYLRFERPLPVAIGTLGLERPWRRTARGTIGEADTFELLRLGAPAVAARAAAGWGGGRYELWTKPKPACAQPCRAADTMVVRWRWDTVADAREFAAALQLYVTGGLHGSAAGADRWRVGAGGAAIESGPGASTTLVLAPNPAAAARRARAARARLDSRRPGG